MATRHYKKTRTELIVTQCPFYDCVIGGYYCVNCVYFGCKNREFGTVRCGRSEQPKAYKLPPQRQPKK